jgi:hypothetical protein
MPLILAVEPDRRQAGHLTQIVRQRVGAELILAETTELALAQIGNRVPDLILVPPLLSPADDAALAAALRVIATAAHVQMLTTPLFASSAPAPKARGVLSAFRRAKPTKPATDGCDPAEFAQQISSYLESAAEERAAAQFTEPPLPVPTAPPPQAAQTSHGYVPLAPGRLYRDEASTQAEFDSAPLAAAPEPGLALPEYEPVAESTEPAAGFEAEPLPVYESPSLDTFVEPDAMLPEPMLESPEPIFATEPAPDSILETPEPVFFEAQEPVLETSEPVYETSEPIFEAQEPVLETPEPVFETAAPVLETLEEPVLETPEPVLETPELVLDAPEPIFETPETFETPEPLAARGSAYPRRIGFVVHDEELEFEPLIAESLDTPFVVEAVTDSDPVATYSAPDDEAIEIVDVDLSSALSEFDDLHVVDAQSELAAQSDADVVEIFETPEIAEAAEPAASHARVIQADALKEFAAAVEALTASEQALAMAEATAAAQAVEFDDLFPPRQPVEPSPLSAWRSWTALEGLDAEAWDAPVPAPVLERAVEKRAPERPDWVQLIESLRLDVERRRAEQPSSALKTARKTPTRPVQDEWGLFDPAQCGFAALLEKLDEITEANASRPRRSA